MMSHGDSQSTSSGPDCWFHSPSTGLLVKELSQSLICLSSVCIYVKLENTEPHEGVVRIQSVFICEVVRTVQALLTLQGPFSGEHSVGENAVSLNELRRVDNGV